MKMSVKFNSLDEPPIVHIDGKKVEGVTRINIDWITNSDQINKHEWSISNIDNKGIEIIKKETNEPKFPNN